VNPAVACTKKNSRIYSCRCNLYILCHSLRKITLWLFPDIPPEKAALTILFLLKSGYNTIGKELRGFFPIFSYDLGFI